MVFGGEVAEKNTGLKEEQVAGGKNLYWEL